MGNRDTTRHENNLKRDLDLYQAALILDALLTPGCFTPV